LKRRQAVGKQTKRSSAKSQRNARKKWKNKRRKIKEKRKKSGQAKTTKTFYVPLHMCVCVCEHLVTECVYATATADFSHML